MSFFRAATRNLTVTEAQGAGLAIGTSAGGAIIGDPIAAAIANLAIVCSIDAYRTPANFAAIGTAAACGLAFGPVGGFVATVALVTANRALKATGADVLLDAKAQDEILANYIPAGNRAR